MPSACAGSASGTAGGRPNGGTTKATALTCHGNHSSRKSPLTNASTGKKVDHPLCMLTSSDTVRARPSPLPKARPWVATRPADGGQSRPAGGQVSGCSRSSCSPNSPGANGGNGRTSRCATSSSLEPKRSSWWGRLLRPCPPVIQREDLAARRFDRAFPVP
jgi:hypothetical protein